MDIFELVCDLPLEERPAVLEAECGDDADLRSKVERMLARMRRYDEAEPMYVKLQQQAETLYGESDPRALGLLGSVARVRAERGDVNAALATFNELLERQRTLFSDDHPEIQETLDCIKRVEAASGE